MAEIICIVKIERRRWTNAAIWMIAHGAFALAYVIGADRAIAAVQPAFRLVAKHGFRPVICG